MAKTAARNYTKPELRERLKKKVTAGTKGGRAGQWSARKAQLLATEYENAGGGYAGKKTAAQKHLNQWTDEKWQTKDGRKAKRKSTAGGTETARYLPKKAWDELSEDEKKATDTKKRRASKTGRQFVANTGAAKKARRKSTTSREKK